MTCQRLFARGEHISVIAYMSTKGILDCSNLRGGVDGDAFYRSLQQSLLPHLLPYNGSNPSSVVIMDNASIHHIEEVGKTIQDAGSLLIPLPPYSPDYNPIENAFSKVKTVMKDMEESPDYKDLCVDEIVLASFSTITAQNCRNWIGHAKIYSSSN